MKALEIFKFEGVKSDQIQIAKHQPPNFKWVYLDPEETITVKNKKGKGQGKTFKVSEIDVKQHPIILKDGDEIGVRLETEAGEDDWQTEEDKRSEKEFKDRGGQQKEEKSK